MIVKKTHAFRWDVAKRPLQGRAGFLVDTVGRVSVFALSVECDDWRVR
jgi:hypothetical protein